MSFYDLSQILSVFFLTLVFILILIRYAPKLGLIDIPNHRSVHADPVPRGAGIAMFLAIFLTDAIFTYKAFFGTFLVYLAVAIILFVGILDDRYSIGHKTKFVAISLATVILYYDHIAIFSLGYFFGYHLTLSWMALPFTIFAVVGFTNAFNLIDGLDGLSGTIGVVILGTLFYIGYIHHDIFLTSISLIMISAISAFLVFNWNPAKVFMGDSGSLAIGFIISVLAIKALSGIQPTSIFFIAAIPIMDTLIVMIRRLRNGHSPFSPDKLHIHHLMLKFFDGNVKKTVLFLAVLQLSYSILGLNFIDYEHQRYIIVLFILNVTIFYILLNGMIKRNGKSSKRKAKKYT